MAHDGKRTIQSIERAVAILDYLADKSNGERLTTLSRELDLNKSTAFSLISSLEAYGLVSQDQETGRYSLGLRMLHYGLAVQNHMDMVRDAQPHLEKLSALYGETAHMATLSGTEIVYVAKAESTRNIRMVTQIGGKTPAHCSALGKVLLAALPEEQLSALIEQMDFTRYTPATVTDPARFLQELEDVRRNGYAYDQEERESGLFCIAAPILDAQKKCIAAISISIPAGRAAEHDIAAITKSVLETANTISTQLGHN